MSRRRIICLRGELISSASTNETGTAHAGKTLVEGIHSGLTRPIKNIRVRHAEKSYQTLRTGFIRDEITARVITPKGRGSSEEPLPEKRVGEGNTETHQAAISVTNWNRVR